MSDAAATRQLRHSLRAMPRARLLFFAYGRRLIYRRCCSSRAVYALSAATFRYAYFYAAPRLIRAMLAAIFAIFQFIVTLRRAAFVFTSKNSERHVARNTYRFRHTLRGNNRHGVRSHFDSLRCR